MSQAGWHVAEKLVGNWVSCEWRGVMGKKKRAMLNQTPTPVKQSNKSNSWWDMNTRRRRCLQGENIEKDYRSHQFPGKWFHFFIVQCTTFRPIIFFYCDTALKNWPSFPTIPLLHASLLCDINSVQIFKSLEAAKVGWHYSSYVTCTGGKYEPTVCFYTDTHNSHLC